MAAKGITAREAAREPFLPLMRQLVRAYQAFERFDAVRLRERGLTVSQADVLFTLGNTEGMTFRELGERTLITKGTLTGVVDRMEAKGLVERRELPDDRRCTIVTLTAAGAAEFDREFPLQVTYLAERFGRLGVKEMKTMRAMLTRLTALFE